jgi:CubicO group peptidase (beta-lactamase class C family)
VSVDFAPRHFHQFYQRGQLDLDMPLAHPYLLGPDFAQNGKSTITARNLLLHNAGFPADPFPAYGSSEFGCPATNSSLHPPLTFSCEHLIFQAVLEQTLKNPVGAVFLYSDLSMITLSFTLGKLVQQLNLVRASDLLPVCLNQPPPAQQQYLCWYEAYIRLHVFSFNPSSWQVPAFLPPDGTSCPACNIAPAYYDADYRHQQMWGQVSDANAYAMGGISGHAGVFANAPALANLVSNILFAGSDSSFVNATTVAYFIKAQNLSQVQFSLLLTVTPAYLYSMLVSQSSRALGWDTNDYVMDTYRGCGNFSQLTFTHTGL